MDDSGAAAPIVFKSYKSRRIACSALSAEANAFADLYDDAYAFRSQVEHALSVVLGPYYFWNLTVVPSPQCS